jgi:hypothetical protein
MSTDPFTKPSHPPYFDLDLTRSEQLRLQGEEIGEYLRASVNAESICDVLNMLTQDHKLNVDQVLATLTFGISLYMNQVTVKEQDACDKLMNLATFGHDALHELYALDRTEGESDGD